MKTVDISIEDRIEAARARLKTAYDQYRQAEGSIAKETARLKWEERKTDLNILLNQNNRES